MSNKRPFRRRLSRAQQDALAVLGPLDGERIPGGCPDCDAYRTVEPASAGVWTVNVHHDDSCPALARRWASGSPG